MRVALLVLVLGLGVAGAQSIKGWEIYSWRSGDAVAFALLPGTNRNKTLAEIQKTPLALAEVKKQLGALKKGEEVFWSVGSWPALDLPSSDPKDPRRQVADEIGRLGLKLSIVPVPENVGTITMASDKAIEMRLRSLPPGPIAETVVHYKPGDAKYKETIDHVGGLVMGESKYVPPWPSR